MRDGAGVSRWQAEAAAERARTEQRQQRFFVLQCVSGPSVRMVVRSLLSYGRASNLRTHAVECNRQLKDVWIPEWMPRFHSGELALNIVLLDFVTLCPELIQTIVHYNVRPQ